MIVYQRINIYTVLGISSRIPVHRCTTAQLFIFTFINSNALRRPGWQPRARGYAMNENERDGQLPVGGVTSKGKIRTDIHRDTPVIEHRLE